MKPHCEIVVKEILPGIRSMIAKELVFVYSMNQCEAAKALGISQPAISQYLRELRGRKQITENDAVVTEVKKLSEKIFKKEIIPDDIAMEFCSICDKIKIGNAYSGCRAVEQAAASTA